MKLYINKPKEDWVVDRFIEEWNTMNFETSTNPFLGKKVIWLISPWTWKKIPFYLLKKNKVICTIHHIDEDKFDELEEKNFNSRDKIVDVYHVISQKTYDQVKKLTNKPIVNFPFWVNQHLWKSIETTDYIYEKYSLNKDEFYVGSFQRDTEGSDLKSPKLSKGPDQFLKIVKELNQQKDGALVVLLTGKRRNYLLENLEKEKIRYKYFEMMTFEGLNELYNILNLYIVSSRFEGGPQSIMECAVTKTPIISTDVGIAGEILSPQSIYNMNNFINAKPDIKTAYKNVQEYLVPAGFDNFNLAIKRLYES